MCGLFSLKFANIDAIAEMGVAGGVGVMFALTLSLVLLPICLTFNRTSLMGAAPRSEDSKLDLIDRCIQACVNASLRIGLLTTIAIFALLTGIAIYGISQLKVSHDDLATIPDDMEVKKAVLKMDTHVGGVSSAVLVVEPKKGTMKQLELLQGLEQVSNDVKATELDEIARDMHYHCSMLSKKHGRHCTVVHRTHIGSQIHRRN